MEDELKEVTIKFFNLLDDRKNETCKTLLKYLEYEEGLHAKYGCNSKLEEECDQAEYSKVHMLAYEAVKALEGFVPYLQSMASLYDQCNDGAARFTEIIENIRENYDFRDIN